jgi:tetraacyldisaccharide-1-P 4'-kinase
MGGALAGAQAVPTEIVGAITASGERIALERLRELRLGLLLAIARPERVLVALERAGIVPRATSFAADHDVPRLPPRAPPLDGWLTTAKCATKLRETSGNPPIWRLEQRLSLPDRLLALLAGHGPRIRARGMVGSAACFSGALSAS